MLEHQQLNVSPFISIHRCIKQAIRKELRRKPVSQRSNILWIKQNYFTCTLWTESNWWKMSLVMQEQTSFLMVQMMMRKTCVSLRKTQGNGVTPASTTQSWTRPGVPPTPPPSSRCVTAMSNGKVATFSV